jgi:hypothetical protein
LLARNVDVRSMRDKCGASLPHYVAWSVEHESNARFLLPLCGSDAVNAVDASGMTPLHYAASRGKKWASRMLLEFGADIDRQSRRGLSALHCCNFSQRCRDDAHLELLLVLGADVRLVDENGQSVCHLLPERGASPRDLCALVAAGGDLDQPNNNGETPRMIAIRRHFALPTADEIDAARQRIAKTRLDLVRERAFQICVGLQSFRLNALQLCEIMMHSFGAFGALIAFHQWWAIATKVKHFLDPANRKTINNRK